YSGIYFATDMLSEKYGKRVANRAVMIGFAISCIILIMISLSLMFQPSAMPETAALSRDVHEAFRTLFNFTPRFVLGSLAAYLISQHLDVYIYHAIRDWTGPRHLWLRNNGSTMTSQAVDTLIYSLVVWWGIVELRTAVELGLSKYVIKFLIALLDTPFIYLGRRWDTRALDWHAEHEEIHG
ncbi:MAG TPA: queuosine precursor transporter, partial [Candidatus Binatia bacterium]